MISKEREAEILVRIEEIRESYEAENILQPEELDLACELRDALTAERERAEKAVSLAWILFNEASLNAPRYQWKEWQDSLRDLDRLENGTPARDSNRA